MVSELTRGLFEKHIGEMFTVIHSQTDKVELKLIDTVDTQAGFKKKNGGPALETFAVHFEGPADKALSQATFRFSHPVLGTFDLFMVPIVSLAPDVRRYEIIINRFLSQ